MNYRILARILGIITGAIGVAFVICLFVAYHYAKWDPAETAAMRGFSQCAIVAMVLTLGLELVGIRAGNKLFAREALASIGLSWILATLLGALPYVMVAHRGFADGVFEAASGFTTTGASIFSDVESLPHSLLFWRSLSQWIGGLGVVVFFVAILSFMGAGAKMLFSHESSAQAEELDSERVQTGVSHIVRLYVLLSILCSLAFYVAGMNVFDAFNHMCTTLSTGGFSTKNASIGWYDNALIDWLCIVFMTIGGTSFVLMLKIRHGQRGFLRSNTELKAYLTIILVATVVCSIFNWWDGRTGGVSDTIRHSAFAVVSVMTTTGFATKDFDLWMPVLHSVLLALMVIGGCSGSTSGGVKVVRFVTALRHTKQLIEKSFRSNVVRSVRINGRPISADECQETTGFLIITALVVGAGFILMALFEPRMSFEGSFSATLACFFNVGPGFKEVGPMRSYADIGLASKYLLSLLMIIGRLELFAILALFSPALWRKF
jgi:trk system potassium uptake protein